MKESFINFKKTYDDCEYPVVIYDCDFNLIWANKSSYNDNAVFKPEKEHALSQLNLDNVKELLKTRRFARLALTPVLSVGGDVTFAALDDNCYAAWFLKGGILMNGLYSPINIGSAEIIAHAIRNYVSEIALASSAVEADLSNDSPEIEGQFQNIRRSSYKILRNIQNIEWLSRFYREGECLNRRTGDLVELVSALCKSTSAIVTPTIPISLSVPDKPLNVSIDVGFFEKSLLNVLLNSMKYTRDGNSIEVTLSSTESTVSLTVKDKGAGIVRENLVNVCDPFFSSEPANDSSFRPGIGLGLTVAALFCEAHGGSLIVSSEFGEGTTILMSFAKGESSDLSFSSTVSKYVTNKFSPVCVECCELCSLPK